MPRLKLHPAPTLAACAALLQAPVWCASWTAVNTGLPSAAVGIISLVSDPSTPGTFYARAGGFGFTSGPSLFKTSDGGATWRPISSVIGVNQFGVHPRNSSLLYGATQQGIVKSTNGGDTWIFVGPAPPPGTINLLALDPVSTSTLYVTTSYQSLNGSGFVAPVATVYKSNDSGGSWTELHTGLPASYFISLLVIDPVNPSTIYISAPSFGGPGPAGLPTGSVIKSTDGGTTWSALNIGLPPPAGLSLLAVDPVTPSTLYGASGFVGGGPSAILKSTDAGRTWSPLSGVPSNTGITSLLIDPKTPSNVYASVFTAGSAPPVWSLIKSTDGGQTWTTYSLNAPANTILSSLVLDPSTPSTLSAAFTGVPVNGLPNSRSAILQSKDGGQTWNLAPANGLSVIDIRALALNPRDSNTIYAGGSTGVFLSADAGASWNPTGLSSYTGAMAADPVTPGILYAQTGNLNGCDSDDQLLLRSTDGGGNWDSSVSPLNSGCILSVTFPSTHSAPMLIDPSNTNTLYLAESDTQDGYAAVLRTTDGGQNWFVLWDSFFGLQAGLQALAIDPAHPGTLYVGTDDILSGFPSVQVQPGMRGLFKSTDAGATWYDTGLTKNAVNLLAVDPSNPLTLYAGTEGPATQPTGFQGVFKSSNAGAAWQAVNKGLEALMNNALTTGTALAVDPANPSALYLGTGNAGVFRSLDAGATWSALNDGLGNLQVRALLVSPKPHAVYAATPSGVFKIVDQ